MSPNDFRNQTIAYANELRKPYDERTGPMKYASISPYTAEKHQRCNIKFITEYEDPEQAFVSFITWAYAQR